MRTQVKLTKNNIKEIIEYAELRNRKAKRFGNKTYNGVGTSADTHLIGLIGEAAVAYYFGLDFDKEIFDAHGDSGVDLVLKNGTRCAIKTTTYWKEPLLRAEVKQDKDIIDVYIAVYVNRDDYSDVWIIGWQDRHHVVSKTPRRLTRHGPDNYILEEDELENIKTLEEYHE